MLYVVPEDCDLMETNVVSVILPASQAVSILLFLKVAYSTRWLFIRSASYGYTHTQQRGKAFSCRTTPEELMKTVGVLIN